MGSTNYKINFDLGSKLDLVTAINKQVFPLLNQAVKAVAAQTAANWQKAVYGAKLWQGEKDKYASSITWSMTNEWSAMVESDYEYAQDIETGRPARDLKKMLSYSLKVRQSKAGNRYLYIPFRHNTPGSSNPMPTSVYALAKELTPSSVTGMGTRRSGTGASDVKTKKFLTVPQAKYNWGSRLPAGLTQKAKPHHATDLHAGMVRFDTSTPGGSKSSAFMTFRTMSEKSQGWIVPAQPGQYLVKKVVEEMQPKAVLAFKMAIQSTLAKGG